MPPPPASLPYRIATLVDLRDRSGRVLLLKRKKAPNLGLCSPIGGKLHMDEGESPARCAQRETLEEIGLDLPIDRFHLLGIISEAAYEGRGHWLLFYYRVLGWVDLPERETDDGWLQWHRFDQIDALPIPDSDRRIIWPLVRAHDTPGPEGKPGFFALHIDCARPDMAWTVEQSSVGWRPPARAD